MPLRAKDYTDPQMTKQRVGTVPYFQVTSMAKKWSKTSRVGLFLASPSGLRMKIDGRTLWTWCAWDSLFIPEILGEQAQVESRDPHTGGTIRLTVTPEGVRSQEPETTVVSFVAPDAERFKSADNVMASFCHFVFFFESRESGEAWATKHEGTFLLTLDEAAELAKRLNARNWGAALPNSTLEEHVEAHTISDVAE